MTTYDSDNLFPLESYTFDSGCRPHRRPLSMTAKRLPAKDTSYSRQAFLTFNREYKGTLRTSTDVSFAYRDISPNRSH